MLYGLAWAALIVVLLVIYLQKVNNGMSAVPADALALSPTRWTIDTIKESYNAYTSSPKNMSSYLPPRTGNRYIVVGGSGFLGKQSSLAIALLPSYGL